MLTAMRLWWATVLAGCAEPYHPGSLVGENHTYGCIDLSVRSAWPTEAEGPVIEIDLGNRCDHSVLIDLRQLRVAGIDRFGERVALIPYDPDHEIVAARIYANGRGWEHIEYHVPETTAIGELERLEVDLGHIVTRDDREEWLPLALPTRGSS